MKNSQNGACFIHQILQHYFCGKVYINIMGSLYASYQLTFIEKRLCLMSIHKSLNHGILYTFLYSGKDCFCDYRILSKLSLVCCYEVLIQIENLKAVTSLCQKKELVLRHNLSEMTITVGIFYLLIEIGELHLGKLLGSLVSDIYLVWPVSYTILKATNVLSHFL